MNSTNLESESAGGSHSLHKARYLLNDRIRLKSLPVSRHDMLQHEIWPSLSQLGSAVPAVTAGCSARVGLCNLMSLLTALVSSQNSRK
ncbi:hypothetical protein J6590_093962 [Homalodisca vitripennis]|nr:hypothetical protein J6590_093962 [Homalodisca vitripennis]